MRRGLIQARRKNRIVVPPFDGAVIAAATGRHPDAVDDALAPRLTLATLDLTVRADLEAERSLARLTRLLGQAGRDEDAGPRLSDMYGLAPVRRRQADLERLQTGPTARRAPGTSTSTKTRHETELDYLRREIYQREVDLRCQVLTAPERFSARI